MHTVFPAITAKKKASMRNIPFSGKYQSISWWPGHIVPVVQVYKWVGDNVPSLDELSSLVYFQPHMTWIYPLKNRLMEFY